MSAIARIAAASEAPDAGALATSRAAALLPEGLIHDDEIVILVLRPSPLYALLSCSTSLVVIALISFFLAYVSRLLPAVGWTDTQAFAFGVSLGAIRLGWQSLEWYSRIFVLTDRRVLRRMGVLRVAVFQTELKNIQHTSVFSSLRERVCGLGTIGFATSGSDVYEAFWMMIRRPFVVHKTVVEAIRRYGNP